MQNGILITTINRQFLRATMFSYIFEQNKGNFSLWFNKFTPIVINGRDKLYHTCNNNGKTSDAVNYYKEKYDSFT
jgi:hypothetical protein